MSSRSDSRETFLQRTTIWIPAGVIALLTLPMAVTSRTFGNDWTLHLWLIRQQEMNIQANGRPGLFLSAKSLGAFYPIFAFVGSGLYSLGAYLALALGDRPIVAYKLLYVLALCLAYGGMTWLSWQVGLRGWRSQMPGLVIVTSAYTITNMAGRGDLGELMAVSAIPFIMAAVAASARASRLRPLHLLAVTAGVFLLTGSHNITLLYGVIFLALLALALLAAFSRAALLQVPRRRPPAVVAAAAIGAGLNAWYLLPDLRYGFGTFVGKFDAKVRPATSLSAWDLLLNPLRPSQQPHPDIRVAIPWLFALWAVVVAVFVWRRIDVVSRRMIVLLIGISALYLGLMAWRAPWSLLPHFLYNLQFTLRLNSYVMLATALLLMIVLAVHARTDGVLRGRASAALTALALFTVIAATWQTWAVPSTYVHRGRSIPTPHHFADIVVADRYRQPLSWYEHGGFREIVGRVMPEVGTAHKLIVPESKVRGSTFSGRIAVPEGPRPFRTNISAGPHFVRLTGIRQVGITRFGFVIAVRAPGTPKSHVVPVTIRPASSVVLRCGSFVSFVSLLALAALVAWCAFDAIRRRVAGLSRGRDPRAGPAGSHPHPA